MVMVDGERRRCVVLVDAASSCVEIDSSVLLFPAISKLSRHAQVPKYLSYLSPTHFLAIIP